MKKFAKKYALVFIVIVFAITMILWPLATKESVQTTQEDPGTADSGFSVNLTSVMDYGAITGILENLEYDSVDELIRELDINRDDIPETLQYVYDKYWELCDNLKKALKRLDGVEVISDEDAELDEDAGLGEDVVSDEDVGLLVEARSYLDEGEFDKTYLALTNASDLAEDIEDLLEDVDSANEQIIKILGNFAPADQTVQAAEFRARLVEDKSELEKLWALYESSSPQNITTLLDLKVQEQMYPGQTYTIHGEITYDGETPAIEREITLLWDGEPLNTADSYRAQSSFEIEVTPDENTTLGEHTLTLIIEPQDQHSIASKNKTIIITKDSPEIRIEDLSYKLLSRKVQIKGKLDSETSLDDAILVIEFKGRSIEVSPSPEGELWAFEALLNLPLGLVNIGGQEIKIRFEPSETWQSPTEITTEIFVLDVFSLGFISTAFVAVGMVVFVARRGRPEKGGNGILEVPPSPGPTMEFINEPQWGFKEEYPEGIRGQIAKSYVETMKIVENITGVSMGPYMTLREFLRETRPKLNGAAGAFKELTYLTENALYCPRIPSSDDRNRAENLALTVKESLKA